MQFLRGATLLGGRPAQSSLFAHLARQVSHPKTYRDKLRIRRKLPEKYQFRYYLKRWDYRQKGLTFPMSLQGTTKYVYSPPKKIVPDEPPRGDDDHINFKRMTGNELLLNLQNAQYYRNKEVIDCFTAFKLLPKLENVNWEQHPYFKRLLERVDKGFPQFSSEHKAYLVRTYTTLGLKRPTFWKKAAEDFLRIHPSLKGKNFAYFFNDLMTRKEMTDDMRVELAKLLPRELWRFNPDDLTLAFKHIVDYDLLSEHLWHRHFHILFWRRPLWLKLRNFPLIIDYMVKIDYLEEVEWWNESFLPSIDFYLPSLEDATVAERLIESLENLNGRQPAIEVENYVQKLSEKIDYLRNILPLHAKANFFTMVKNDLKYYKEKETAKMLQERGQEINGIGKVSIENANNPVSN